jgi:catechol 2,3-dioxygenase-like lactoylglutathione lyase family enzyme
MNFQGIVVNVSDLDQSIDFYREVYGFTLLSKNDQLAAISAPGIDRPQVLVLRALGGTGRVGARHIGMRALVLEVESVDELDEIERALDKRGYLVGRITDHATWAGVVGHDPDRIAIVTGAGLGDGRITLENWAALDESLYALGE